MSFVSGLLGWMVSWWLMGIRPRLFITRLCQKLLDNASEMFDHEIEDIVDDDNIVDKAVEFDIPQYAEVNDDPVPEMKDFLKKIVGNTLGRMVEECLLDWRIDKFLTVTVDNVSLNSLLIAYLKCMTKDRKTTILNHEFLHVRCSTHILNLIVCDGLQEINVTIARVRNMVRYVRSSTSRMAEFWSYVENEKIVCRLKPYLDVSTRWNYTLEIALTYQKAFDQFCDDPNFKLNVREEEMDENFDDVNAFESIGRRRKIEKGIRFGVVSVDGVDETSK
ncbi:hypothetical protein RHSIM_Rhsim04G0162100 [Rhododendron simsii]|uniref:Transposase n=1 Tax=Rhododendron simsii TaxID=118357 RepID=A0A834H0I8_RHOSS|nr:hypothetical protein RHSIM_Rhsim04G0162100 [Rhododendron simsii]